MISLAVSEERVQAASATKGPDERPLALEARGLVKQYREVRALDGVDLAVPVGSVFGFLGPNGAGKTTALRILTGLARPTSGSARIFGNDVTSTTTAARSLVGFLPDVPGFYDWMTAEEFLRFAGGLFGLDDRVLEERTKALLDLAGLAGVKTRVGGYSRGMKQRLGVAQALVNAPKLLMLDEPTSALDPIGRKEVLEMIASLGGRTTVFFSTHILADVERVCDTVAILDRGRIVAQAPIDELKARYSAHRLVVEVDRAVQEFADALGQREWATSVELENGVVELSVSDVDTAQREVPAMVAERGLALRRFEGGEVTLEASVRGPRERGLEMRGFARFAGKEVTEILRTWRIWVLPGVLLFFAVTGPILAKFTPQLIQSLGASQQGISITIPKPTYLDAYTQWIKNLGQIGVFLLIGVSAGIIAGERASGTAALVLTKPVSRGGFVVAKYLVHAGLLVLAIVANTVVTWAVTAAIFGEAPPEPLVSATAVWLVFALVLLAAMVLLSAAFSTLAAVGAGVGVFAALGILTIWGPAVRNTPVGLIGAPSRILQSQSAQATGPLVAAAVAIPLLVLAAIWVFRRQEL